MLQQADRDLLLEVALVALAPVLVDALPPLLRAVPCRHRHPLLLLPVPDDEISCAQRPAKRGGRCCSHAGRRRRRGQVGGGVQLAGHGWRNNGRGGLRIVMRHVARRRWQRRWRRQECSSIGKQGVWPRGKDRITSFELTINAITCGICPVMVLLIHGCGLWVLLMYVSRSVVCGDS